LTAGSTGTPFKAEEPGPQYKINNRLHRKLDNLLEDRPAPSLDGYDQLLAGALA
jgi:hypothetical protein